MALTFYSDDPQGLLDALKEAIDEGHAPTWVYDDDEDFTHDRPQWKGKAWLQPEVLEGQLTFTILHPEGEEITSEVYAVFHGRFVEFALNHADQHFTKVDVSALPEAGDVTGTTDDSE